MKVAHFSVLKQSNDIIIFMIFLH